MNVRDANRRQNSSANQKMPATGIVLMVMDRVISTVLKQLPKALNEAREVPARIGNIVNFGSQSRGFLIKYSSLTAGYQEIHSDIRALGPKPQHLHQPGFGTTHTKCVNNLENPDCMLALHS
jgi:hypothetical protein